MQVAKISIAKIECKCDELAGLLRAIAHPQRLLILGHLTNGPKTVGELQSHCEISQSQLSQFLARMRLEGLVSCERRGRYQYYSAADQRVIQLIRSIQSIFCK